MCELCEQTKEQVEAGEVTVTQVTGTGINREIERRICNVNTHVDVRRCTGAPGKVLMSIVGKDANGILYLVQTELGPAQTERLEGLLWERRLEAEDEPPPEEGAGLAFPIFTH